MAFIWIATAFAILGLTHGASLMTTDATAVLQSVEPTCDWTDCDVACGKGNRQCTRSDTGKLWNIDCHVQDCKSDADDYKCGHADIVFVLDSSASIGEKNWWKTKQFVIDVCKGLIISPEKSRIGLVTYSNSATTHWNLGEYNTMAELEEKIWSVDYTKGNTNTYSGLFNAEEIFNSTARIEVKNITILLTDGKANNRAEKLVPFATEMHGRGHEVFAIGISGDVVEQEIKDIASEPKDDHAFFVTGYDVLQAITDKIIDQTCDSASQVTCDAWSEWTQCILLDQTKSCGDGLTSRFRICTFTTGGREEKRVQTEHKKCEQSCLPRCAKCDFTRTTIGYLPVEEDECAFILCQKISETQYIEHPMRCGPGTIWGKDIWTCIRADGKCGPVETTTLPSTPSPACPLKRVDGDRQKFLNGGWEQSCADGTIFSERACGCVPAGPTPDCSSDVHIHFPLNSAYSFEEVCNRAYAENMNNRVTVQDDAVYFDGSSKLQIPYFHNWFGGKDVVTVAMWFKYTGNDKEFRGLFSNGDCDVSSSFLINIGDDKAQGSIQLEIQNGKRVFSASTKDANERTIQRDQWYHVMMQKTETSIKYFINGEEKERFDQLPESSTIQNRLCDVFVGFSHDGGNDNFFQGYITDLRVYTKENNVATRDVYLKSDMYKKLNP